MTVRVIPNNLERRPGQLHTNCSKRVALGGNILIQLRHGNLL
jgi:hypothetical protein